MWGEKKAGEARLFLSPQSPHKTCHSEQSEESHSFNKTQTFDMT
jgi:hypothetical protein